MVSVEDPGMSGSGHALKQQLWDSAKQSVQEWTGQSLAGCSLYGIRIYEEGLSLGCALRREFYDGI